jgi:monothiol glutaredoxin
MVSPEDIRRRIEEAFPGALDRRGPDWRRRIISTSASRRRNSPGARRGAAPARMARSVRLGRIHAPSPDGVAAGGQGMNDAIADIEQEIRENKVVLYMKGTPAFPMCGFSAAAVKVLKEVGVPFKAVDVLAEPEKREAIKQFSNWPTIPQLYIGGKFVGGSDILREMHARGEFAQLVR